MFEHILVPVDFSEKNEHALDVAVKVAALGKGTVTLLHVIEIMADTNYSEFNDFYQELEHRSQRKMEILIAPYHDSPVQLEECIAYGNRTQEILNFVEEHVIDLIIMSSHKVDMTDQASGWGTISYKVGILAPCPIMLVK